MDEIEWMIIGIGVIGGGLWLLAMLCLFVAINRASRKP